MIRDLAGTDSAGGSGILNSLEIWPALGYDRVDTWDYLNNRIEYYISLNDGNWHMMTSTYDKTDQMLRLYIDGTLRANKTQSLTS